ncbi:MAG: CDP-archaeol synthase [Gemmatimonadaceae bacterium]|nr:CDP-archaeol synthase [Chitinophagaceae bacterium]
MALNISTLKTRALTSLFFVIIMLGGLLWNHWSFFILFSVIHFGCWREYQRLIGKIDPAYSQITPFHKYGVMIAGWCIMLAFTNRAWSIGGMRLHEIGWWAGLIFAFVLPVIELLFARKLELKNIGYSLLGLLYISLSWGLMVDLRTYGMSFKGESSLFFDFGWQYPLLTVAAIWINDTMAYLVGSVIGKTPFSKISPKKTWEGTIGGMIMCVLTIFIFHIITIGDGVNLLVIHYTIMAAIAAVTGTAGDLLESWLKRRAGVKDSGQLMPGHGGFLDRFDSLLIAVVFVWAYVVLFVE